MHRFVPSPLITPAMSSQSLDTLTDKLQQAYFAVLLQIVHNLEKDQQVELRFYCTGRISEGDPRALNMMCSLQNAGKISWKDVRFLKGALREVQRLDLYKTLTEFEIKRDIFILLDFYARKKQGSESFCFRHVSETVEKVAGYLVTLMTKIVQDCVDVSSAVRSLVGPRKGIRNVLVEFENEIERELSDPWSKLTFLVVIAGEIAAFALANEEHLQKPEILKLCSTAADELCFRMMKLGNWVSFQIFMTL